MKKYVITALILFFLGYIVFAKSEGKIDKPFAKNQVYLSAGWLLLYGNADICYERNLRYKEDGFLKSINWNITYGRFAYWESAGPLYKTCLSGMTGKVNNHMEFQIGAVVMFDKVGYDIGISNANYPIPGTYQEPKVFEYTKLFQAAFIGYRYQKPTGGFVFRTGLGFQEMLSLSLGYAF